MKKFSMGMMLSSLLLIQVGCGEEAPPVATPDPGAMMSHAADAGAHSAAPATETPATETPATEAPATEAVKDAAP